MVLRNSGRVGSRRFGILPRSDGRGRILFFFEIMQISLFAVISLDK